MFTSSLAALTQPLPPGGGGNLEASARQHPFAYLLALLLGMASVWLTMGSPLGVLQGSLMIDTDYPNAAAAFELFVRDGWRWPLGANPDFGGVNLFFSDGAPWFALLAKAWHGLTGMAVPLHALVLVNMLLWPMMAWRLAACLHVSAGVRWMIVGLLTFNLITLVRMIGAQHIALGSWWVVLWAMCAVPLAGEPATRWRRWEFLVALAVAVWSHAYLGAMAALIILVCLLVVRRWVAAVLVLLWPLLLLYAIGALQASSTPMGGAKAYALDLGAFTKSLGWGIAGNLYDIHEPTQGDAIAYLGTGAWLLLLACGVCALAFRRLAGAALLADGEARRRWWCVLVAALALTAFAMSFDLRLAGHVLLRLEIPSLVKPLYESFRVTGRFAAPLAFLLVVLAVLWWGTWKRRLPASLWWGVTLVAVILQVADARHAGRLSPPLDWQAAAAEQQASLAAVLDGQAWSGRVFKDVGFFELEEHRLLDYLLVQQGAREIRVAHGARLEPTEVERRSGYAEARRGDVVILRDDAESPACREEGTVKHFRICLL